MDVHSRCAWLIRAVGVAVIVAAVVCVIWDFRRTPRRAMTACACLVLPVVGAVLVECGLNLKTSGRFRPSTGGSGVMLLTRARYFQGSPLTDTDTTARLLRLLPERDTKTAYMVNKLDGCIARCHAIRDDGMDEWMFNRLAARSGFEIIANQPKAYVKAGVFIFVRHLLRRKDSPPASWVPHERREPIITHEAARDFHQSQKDWFAFWFLPHCRVEESTALVADMRTAAEQRAPFGRPGFWASVRHLTLLPVVVDVMGVVRSVASLWPGFALMFFGLLGLNRRTCGLLAIAYVLEALVIAACGSTDTTTARYQFVWLATDTALVACLVAPAVSIATAYVFCPWTGRLQESLSNSR